MMIPAVFTVLGVPIWDTNTIDVTLDFDDGNGDIDLAGYADCASDAVTTSAGHGNSETISLTNNGSRPAFLYWQVTLSSSTRNTYNMTVSFE